MMTPREAELTRQLEAALADLAAVRRENQLLRQKIDQLIKRLFGSSSEEVSRQQLELELALGEVTVQQPAPPAPAPRAPKQKSARQVRVPDSLPVVEEMLEPAEVNQCPDQWRRIGQEVSEQLDYEPGRFFRRRLIRPRYVSQANLDLAPIIAPLPNCLLERAVAAPGLLAHVLVSKYCDHLPLYRQESIFANRTGVFLPRQTLARWVELAADWLKPVYEVMRGGVLAGGYVQVDETPVRYLEPGRGQSAQGYLWTCLRPQGDVIYHWETGRAADCLDRLLTPDFTGTIQCDGYAAYDCFARQHPKPITLAACWAHVRRKFHEARAESPRLAAWFLYQIQLLYQLEAQLRETRAGPRLRQARRAAASRMVVERLRRAMLKMQDNVLPKSLMGQAISYAQGQWNGLVVYLEDGRVEIDNNLVENAIRPTAIGKKNWLFIGAAQAGERSAIIYTIIESCRRRGIDPFTYLRDVLTRLPSMTNHQVPTVTPQAWLQSRSTPLRVAA